MQTTEPTFAIDVADVSKTYQGSKKSPPKHALKNISLQVPRGSIFGLLGPNGAGKSTLINILGGLVRITSGSARVYGYDVVTQKRQARSAIGLVPQELNLDAFFTPLQVLELMAGFYGVPKAKRRSMELLQAVGLHDKANAYARTLSGGMRRRLMVAKALVHAPPVLVLDEPTAGVDVELRRMLWAYVRHLNAQGTTVLLTTHYLEEAQELCQQIAIINHGQVVANDTTANLLRRVDSKEIVLKVEPEIRSLPETLVMHGFRVDDARTLRLSYQPSVMKLGHVFLAVQAAGFTITDVSTRESDLEDIFLQLTRKAA
ncbi:MAG: ABC transporter ATP-binding protein [Alphaproteobacteria bacterium]|nr:ABC transporter ATP-binding protein [Alphaproteobacteria bacterium]